MALNDILFFVLGIGLLISGAWVLISGGTRVAAVLGIPPVVVGLTVVAFGTSAPELFVSILGAVEGSTGLVLGNVIGSNVANLGLILAAAAIMRPVVVEHGLSRNEVPFMLAASIAFTVMVWDGALGRVLRPAEHQDHEGDEQPQYQVSVHLPQGRGNRGALMPFVCQITPPSIPLCRVDSDTFLRSLFRIPPQRGWVQ